MGKQNLEMIEQAMSMLSLLKTPKRGSESLRRAGKGSSSLEMQSLQRQLNEVQAQLDKMTGEN